MLVLYLIVQTRSWCIGQEYINTVVTLMKSINISILASTTNACNGNISHLPVSLWIQLIVVFFGMRRLYCMRGGTSNIVD